MLKDQLKALIQLQIIDADVFKLKRRKESLPKELETLQSQLQKMQVQLKQSEDRLHLLQIKRKEMEIELQTKEDNVKRLTAQLYQIKTNKEYSALQKEIEGLKADNSILEEEVIKLLDEIDIAGAEFSRRKQDVSIKENEFKEESSRLQREVEQIDKALLELDLERQKITPMIEQPLLFRYEKILYNKDGLALVRVENGACQGCHMAITPQMINDIKIGEKLLVCENCARILYICEE